MYGKTFYCKSNLNRHISFAHGVCEQKEKDETKKRSHLLKMRVIGKISILIHFRRAPSKSLCQIRSFLGPMSNIVNISFESKTVNEMQVEMRLHKKYASLQQTTTTRDEKLMTYKQKKANFLRRMRFEEVNYMKHVLKNHKCFFYFILKRTKKKFWNKE